MLLDLLARKYAAFDCVRCLSLFKVYYTCEHWHSLDVAALVVFVPILVRSFDLEVDPGQMPRHEMCLCHGHHFIAASCSLICVSGVFAATRLNTMNNEYL